jgi:hypothetical protein
MVLCGVRSVTYCWSGRAGGGQGVNIYFLWTTSVRKQMVPKANSSLVNTFQPRNKLRRNHHIVSMVVT